MLIISRILFALFAGVCATGFAFINPIPVLAQYPPQNQQLNDLLRQARDYIDAGDYDRAIATYERAAYFDRRNAKIYSGIGYLRTLQGQYIEASRAYQQALALDRNNPDFQYAYAYCLAQMRDNRNAIRAYQRAIQMDSRNIKSYIGLGVVLMREGYHDRALQIYEGIARENPGDGSIYGLMSTALLELDRSREAIERLQRAVQRYPNNAQLWLQLGIFLAGLTENEEGATIALQRAVRLNPDDPRAQLQIGWIYQQQGREELARDMFNKASVTGYDSFEIQMEIGNIFLEQDSYLTATIAYRRAVQLAPDRPEAYYKLGLVLKARNRKADAIAAWNRAMALYRDRGDRAGIDKIQVLLDEEETTRDRVFEPFN
ncbi:MAG: tetratricopeptide repeat protein [Cyanobacteria bacterium SBLK]|nr:tetratricopeptide repeat protein [Cyanobacteria bacterium SBLK]